jgi:hypothetical protein
MREVCKRKRSFQSEELALVAISTRMKKNPGEGWWSWRVYRCPHCRRYHITKGQREEVVGEEGR